MLKKDDLQNAIEAYKRALMEHRDPETLKLLGATEKNYLKKKKKLKNTLILNLALKLKKKEMIYLKRQNILKQ